jgi:hypothetical protein
VFILFLSSSGTAKSFVKIPSPVTSADFAYSVSFSHADVDGDAIPDLLVGAKSLYDPVTSSSTGGVFLTMLARDGTARQIVTISSGLGGLPSDILEGNGQFGISVQLTMDLNA